MTDHYGEEGYYSGDGDTFMPFTKANRVAMDPKLEQLMFNYMLMKLGGQIEFSVADFTAFTQFYQGYRFAYNRNNESITLTSKLRPDEFPSPEIP